MISIRPTQKAGTLMPSTENDEIACDVHLCGQ